MNEEVIADALRAKLNRPEQPEPQLEPLKPEVDVNAPKPVTPDPLATYRLLDYFSVPQHERDDPNVTEKLKVIYKWAQERTGSNDQLDALDAIRQLEGTLGLTHRTDEKLNSLFNWVSLDAQRRRIEREMTFV